MKCTELKEHLALYADGSLKGEEALGVQRHLEGCPSCREDLEGLKGMLGLLKAVPEPPVPGKLHRHIMAGIREERERAKRKRAGRWFGMPRTLAAAAAVFLLFFAGGNLYLTAPLMSGSTRSDYGLLESQDAQPRDDVAVAGELPEAEAGEDKAVENEAEEERSREGALPGPESRQRNPIGNIAAYNAALFALGGGLWYYYRRRVQSQRGNR